MAPPCVMKNVKTKIASVRSVRFGVSSACSEAVSAQK